MNTYPEAFAVNRVSTCEVSRDALAYIINIVLTN